MGVYLKIDKRSKGFPFTKLLLPKENNSVLIIFQHWYTILNSETVL